MTVFILVFLWLLAGPIFGQSQTVAAGKESSRQGTSESLLTRFPLRAIGIVGNEHYSNGEIIEVTGLKIGEPVHPSDFQQAMKKLGDTGAFESLEFRYDPEGDGYKVTFKVKEVDDLYPVRFEGMEVPDEELHQLLREKIPLYSKRAPATGTMTTLIGNVLQWFWTQQGKDSKIIGRLVPIGENKFAMVFQPPSSVKTIAFVTFENTGDLSPLELQRRFNQAAMGVPFSQPRLKELLHHNVRPLYEEKGRLAVKFCPCTTEPDTETQGLLVHVHVEQGPVYTFGKIQFAEGSFVDTSALSRLISFREGETANMSLVHESLAKMEQLLQANGYIRAIARHEREVNHDAKTADIILEVRPGSQYTFNQLTITGLDITGEAAVKKRWGLPTGDPFNASYPTVFLQRVQGMFDNLSKTDSRITINDENKTVDVELIFE